MYNTCTVQCTVCMYTIRSIIAKRKERQKGKKRINWYLEYTFSYFLGWSRSVAVQLLVTITQYTGLNIVIILFTKLLIK